ncbi:iron chelate uptake ABC transporter family permease subunit [Nocardiopsis sp. ATB16-24]|uniref:FecCD family ABC transporter permease n=1 Tax=Nocardiopsis sp. ATB16-24 TaxID=3019555 RepID=UPI00255348B4|nr:iron chelate uptake ABC transporter family permease subunit [Nocardiopsis sp. ATB16-24]
MSHTLAPPRPAKAASRTTPRGSLALRLFGDRLSLLVRPRLLLTVVVLAALSVLALAVSVAVGDYEIPLRAVPAAVIGQGERLDVFFVQGYRLVLVGIGVAAMLGAVRDYLMTRSDLTDAMGAQIWMIGSLHGRGWGEVAAVWIGLALLGPLLSALGGRLRLMELGEDTARGLGVPTRSTQLVALAGASALTGAAIAVAGPIGFVALAAPQLAGRLARTGTTLAGSALMGATLLVIADLVALRALAPVQLPVGVVTAVIGGGYLIWLLYIEWRGQRA